MPEKETESIKITKSFVAKIDSPGWYRDSQLKGFCIRVRESKSGLSKIYAVNAKDRTTNKAVTVTIGRHGVISAEQAREKAVQILAELARGVNPNTEQRHERKEKRKAIEDEEATEKVKQTTLNDLLNDYLASRQLREKTATDYKRFLKRCLPDWLDEPITAITRDMVQTRHLQLSAEHPAQANLTMRILRALFKYAMAVYEDSDGRPVITINPVDRLKHARLWNKVTRRQSLIRPAQLKPWYKAVMALTSAEARDLLLLELFTGLRHGEAIRLEWKNIDFKHKTILVEDTKNHQDHMLPMSTYLLAIIEKRSQTGGSSQFVFQSVSSKHGHISDIRDSIKQVIASSGVEFTEHDLRRTFETTAERLDISYYTLKRLLNHKTGSDPTAGYIVTSAERMRDASQKVADSLAESMGMPAPKQKTSKLRRVQ